MFEFEDVSSGFHDVFLNKYTDSSGSILDLYISDSLQDMLDTDIRSEVATVVGGSNEFTSLVNDLPSSLDLDIGSNDGEISWLTGPKWSGTDIYADVGACVNPNSVMPLIASSLLNSSKGQLNLNLNSNNSRPNIYSPPPSPKENKSHLTFSPHQIKVPSVQIENKRPSSLVSSINRNVSSADNIKKDLLATDLKNDNNNKSMKLNGAGTQNNGTTTNILSGSNTIKLAPGIGGLTFSNSISYNKLKHVNNNNTMKISGSNGNVAIKIGKSESSPNLPNGNILNGVLHNNNTQISNKIVSRSILVQNNKSLITMNGSNSPNHSHHQHQHHQSSMSSPSSSVLNSKITTKSKPVESEYPKPAYSYSCLIAMALKNSRRGSLPVSEIYSFMCEHFPYFKTAPSGWKNSVRHNLSLNKCFKKIEKPATNGGQRKGCLWAMNPAKITKMDEEVLKWSKKNPMAIKIAMVFPEHLEALERGEMKHGSTSDSDGENDTQSDTEENSDSEPDHDLDDNLIETPDSMDDEDNEGAEKEFDVEATDIYDTINFDDDKEQIRNKIHQLHNDSQGTKETNFIVSKKARLDVNYSVGPAGAFEQQRFQQQHQPQPSAHHNRRKMQLVNRII